MYVRRGIGADCAYEGDPTCLGPCYPVDFPGPIPEGSVYCGSASSSSAPSRSPASASGCPAGSTCSIFPGVPNTAVYVMGCLIGAFLFMGVVHK